MNILGIQSEVWRGLNKKDSYNDREWIKEKGLTGLAQDAHIQTVKNAQSGIGIPGGPTDKNSAFMFKGADGYKSLKERGEGTDAGLTFGGFGDEFTVPASGTSIFDPVLCELCYRWFSGAGAQIIDPFAGGSVRGVVASLLGRKYWGCDLRQEQIDANRIQGQQLCLPPHPLPEWVCGDSLTEITFAPECDAVFSCPPYGSLEVYSSITTWSS